MDNVRSAPARTPRPGRFTTRLAGATTIAVVAAGFSAGAAQANYTPEVWDRVAKCESGGNWSINTGNGYYGGLQFHPQTWKGFGGQTYAGNAHQASKAEQIAIARRVLHTQGPGAWPVCSVKAGLTRSNGGADPNAKPGDGGQEPAPSPGETVTRYVDASTAANVRSGPGTGHKVVGSKARGAEVSGTLTNGWLKIGNNQFISSTVLSSSPVDGVAPAPGKVTRYVSASNAANVRSGPGTGYKIVGGKARGAQVSGTLTNGWLNIGNNQFISSTVLSSSPVGGGGEQPGEATRYVSASNAANVRSGPGLDHGIVGGKSRGAQVSGTLSNGWLKIGDKQFISSTVLSKNPV